MTRDTTERYNYNWCAARPAFRPVEWVESGTGRKVPTGPRRHGADRPSDPETSLPSQETLLTNGGNTGVVKSSLLTVPTKRSGAAPGSGHGAVLFLPVHQGAPGGDVRNGAVVNLCHLLH